MEEMGIQGNTGKWKEMWLIVQNNIAPQIHYAESLPISMSRRAGADSVVSASKLLSVQRGREMCEEGRSVGCVRTGQGAEGAPQLRAGGSGSLHGWAPSWVRAQEEAKVKKDVAGRGQPEQRPGGLKWGVSCQGLIMTPDTSGRVRADRWRWPDHRTPGSPSCGQGSILEEVCFGPCSCPKWHLPLTTPSLQSQGLPPGHQFVRLLCQEGTPTSYHPAASFFHIKAES